MTEQELLIKALLDEAKSQETVSRVEHYCAPILREAVDEIRRLQAENTGLQNRLTPVEIPAHAFLRCLSDDLYEVAAQAARIALNNNIVVRVARGEQPVVWYSIFHEGDAIPAPWVVVQEFGPDKFIEGASA